MDSESSSLRGSVTLPTATLLTCTHHWMLESPNGSPQVGGTCVNCGKTKLFQTTLSKDYGNFDARNWEL